MRLWSIHPEYLDHKGLIAVWREGLLAQNVIRGETTGYKNHPQLERFIKTTDPVGSISSYLIEIYRESKNREYHFDRKKIAKKGTNNKIKVTRGQLEFELDHLKRKLKNRDQSKYKQLKTIRTPKINPVFVKTEGDIESWEKGQYMNKIPIHKTQGNVNVQERLRILNKRQKHAVLATDSGSQPYTSLVAFALTPDCSGLIFSTPRKTTKYKNILKNSNVSVLIDTRKNSVKSYMDSEAITILGTALSVRKGKKLDALAAVLLAKHPELKGFVSSASTALIHVVFDRVIHAGQFQSVTVWDCKEKL